MIELVLGGARSGKSRYAEGQACATNGPVIYLATAEAGDDEMRARIERHKTDRSASWQTVEEPVRLGEAIGRYAGKGRCLLIDCLTLWLSNVLFGKSGELQLALFRREKDALLEALVRRPGRILMVSNEVGQGIVSVDASVRRFVDEAGRLHQEIASISDRVVMITAGLPLVLKSTE